jgi:hypothetical protein
VLIGTVGATLGPIIVGIVGKLVKGGKTAAVAWIWVTVIAMAIAAIIALTVVGI